MELKLDPDMVSAYEQVHEYLAELQGMFAFFIRLQETASPILMKDHKWHVLQASIISSLDKHAEAVEALLDQHKIVMFDAAENRTLLERF